MKMSEQIKTGTFEFFGIAYKVKYTYEGCFLNDNSEVGIKFIQPAPEMEDMGWVRERLENAIMFHELENTISDREFQKHFAEEMRSDEERGH